MSLMILCALLVILIAPRLGRKISAEFWMMFTSEIIVFFFENLGKSVNPIIYSQIFSSLIRLMICIALFICSEESVIGSFFISNFKFIFQLFSSLIFVDNLLTILDVIFSGIPGEGTKPTTMASNISLLYFTTSSIYKFYI